MTSDDEKLSTHFTFGENAPLELQCWNWPKRTGGGGVSCRNVWNFAQELKFKADFHSKMSVCRHELGGESSPNPPTIPTLLSWDLKLVKLSAMRTHEGRLFQTVAVQHENRRAAIYQ